MATRTIRDEVTAAHGLDSTGEPVAALSTEQSPDSSAVGGVEEITEPTVIVASVSTATGPTGHTFHVLPQNGGLWGKKPIGLPAADGKVRTIGGVGCLLTCLTMVANWFTGSVLTPDEVNAIAIACGGFVGPLVNVEVLAKKLGLVALEAERVRVTTKSRVDIAAGAVARAFDAGKVCILHVDDNSGLGGDIYGEHFVVALQREDGSLRCADPAPGRFCMIDDETMSGSSVWLRNPDGSPRVEKFYRVVGVIPCSKEVA